MIDPLAAVLAYLKSDADLRLLVGDRIAGRHLYGVPEHDAWPITARALVIRYEAGSVDEAVTWQRPRFEVRCYGPTQQEAARVYRTLVDVTRAIHRVTAQTADGLALIYWLAVEGAPGPDYDDDTGIDNLVTTLEAAVSEEAVA
jgi:hypothetical protein